MKKSNMKEFNKWRSNMYKEYPLYQDKDGYSVGNTPALKAGWKGAMELILITFNKNIEVSDLGEMDNIIDVYKMIEQELEE